MGVGAPSIRPRPWRGLLPGHRTLLVTLIFAGAVVAAGQFIPPAFSVPEYVFPTPSEIVRAGSHSHATLLGGLKATAIGAFGGFLLGNLGGFAAALAIASSVTVSRVLLPMSLALRSIPII